MEQFLGENSNDQLRREPFTDSSGNKMQLAVQVGTYYAFKCLTDNQGVSKDGVGYITEFEGGGSSNYWPGAIMSWYGPGERFSTLEDAMNFYKNTLDS